MTEKISTPLSQEQLAQVAATIANCNQLELAWLSGFLWAKAQSVAAGVAPIEGAASQPASAIKVTILSASQTGNARQVAQNLAAALAHTSLAVNLVQAGNYKTKDLATEQLLFLITSTQGDGEPPEEALSLFQFLASKKAPRLAGLRFAVLALGDSSYPNYCQAGKDFHAKLVKLGATAVWDCQQVDLDIEQPAKEWITKVTDWLNKNTQANAVPTVTLKTNGHTSIQPSEYTKENPFVAELLVNQKITARHSSQDVRHLELDITNTGVSYVPGDTLAVNFLNQQSLIDEFAQYLKLDLATQVTFGQYTTDLNSLLQERVELTKNTNAVVTKYANLVKHKKLVEITKDREKLTQLVQSTPLVELVRQFPAPVQAQQLVDILLPLTPRRYSIASSNNEVGEEIHLTVGRVEYFIADRRRFGGCSEYLTNLAEEAQVKAFIETNATFRLPTDAQAPIIMIGAGTGIAPYRAFMQERQAQQASGKNWLFFGNQTFLNDFLYQLEWQDWYKSKLLSKISLAWSRDQQHKIYVQHRIVEEAVQLWQWIQDGAHIYLCGNAQKMAKDVEQALLTVIQDQGNLTPEQADEYLSELRVSKRYQRDVY